MTDLIVFENASKTFVTPNGPVEASRDINLTVERGEFITLVGPSGCGKSTLLNMIAGIFPPSGGKVLYDGNPVEGYNGHVGYMTQNDHLLTWRTVAANIAVPLEIAGLSRGERRDRVAELADLVGLTKFVDSYPSQLSGGMRKRCALARLLAYSPETLLLDEPFAALDAQLRLRMQMELRSIVHSLGKTVLFVTHDLDEAVALADRCAIFTRGPGTIRTVLDIPLERERDLMRLRHDPRYVELTATLWDEMAPDIAEEEAV
ncbi:ABC transporter ATP-binding protein [Celeribacter indicus]|uniref:ABC transporter ATP-binding protein n=1 Tax=Celeribacter indicus TaxID=1208324 RepID=UPI001C3195D1|nr:ABC transporter ATP-binding protein [Celeribacter indicus]